MSTEIRIPKIGVSMTEGTLVEWFVENGGTVEAGSPLYALEMDKSTNEIDAPTSGVVTIIGQIDEVYEVGALIATIA